MHAIFSNGAVVALCDNPRWVRVKPESGAWIQTNKDHAEALAVNGKLYNINGGTAAGDAPQAIVTEEDGGEYIFQARATIQRNREDSDASFVVLEDTMCDLDAITDARVTAVEDAICDLDMAINGGGAGA